MVIESVSWKRYATPFFSPFKVSYGEHTSSEHVIVRLVDSSGKVGYGDATPLWFFTGEVCEAVEVLLDKVVKNNILGIDVFDKQSIATIIGSIPGNYSLKSCVEMAVYDLRAKLLNVPLHKLLGGKIREKVKVSSGIGIMQKEKTVEAATSLVEKGIRSFKIKVAGKTDFEADRIKAVRDAVGKDIAIRIDANAAYTAKRAIDLGKKVSSCEIEYFEQPVKGDDIDGLREVKKSIDFDIMADESLFSLKDAVRLYEKRAVDIFGIKFAKCGGITEARRTIEFASSVDIPCVMISAFETWIGISANLHLASTSENCYYANDLALWTIQKDSMTGPLKVHGDIVEVPDKPGLGTEADRLFEE
jgi:o-succinylbenzoate synthase